MAVLLSFVLGVKASNGNRSLKALQTSHIHNRSQTLDNAIRFQYGNELAKDQTHLRVLSLVGHIRILAILRYETKGSLPSLADAFHSW